MPPTLLLLLHRRRPFLLIFLSRLIAVHLCRRRCVGCCCLERDFLVWKWSTSYRRLAAIDHWLWWKVFECWAYRTPPCSCLLENSKLNIKNEKEEILTTKRERKREREDIERKRERETSSTSNIEIKISGNSLTSRQSARLTAIWATTGCWKCASTIDAGHGDGGEQPLTFAEEQNWLRNLSWSVSKNIARTFNLHHGDFVLVRVFMQFLNDCRIWWQHSGDEQAVDFAIFQW